MTFTEPGNSVDVHYGGSTGFGRAFRYVMFQKAIVVLLLMLHRESLHGKWGILDIEDAHQSVVELGKLGLADPKRACIYGGSAGGYSTLQAATTLPDAFAAGAALYGISDMKKLDDILHKFEYHLCDRLMGSSYKDNVQLWKDRSPIFNVDKIKMPLLVRIVPCDTNYRDLTVNLFTGTARHRGPCCSCSTNDRDG